MSKQAVDVFDASRPIEITRVYNGGFVLRSKNYSDPGEMSCVMAFSPTDMESLLATIERLLTSSEPRREG